ncbi:SlyX family protein [Stappia sp. 28M-7]|uniref:SlyX family protein n=1 Tax=Stappia sp. 28M-7 TaxID=2762596 RepID=UPI000E73EF7E|nr:SlyX family protein [Stappia sp. 28M-7]MBC2858171.1 SlyX family protein [Stappia sp. 28M-7]
MDRETLARIERLEEQLAFQTRTVEELNEVVTRQADQIDALNRRLTAVVEHVEELEDAAAGNVPVTKPPHY